MKAHQIEMKAKRKELARTVTTIVPTVRVILDYATIPALNCTTQN